MPETQVIIDTASGDIDLGTLRGTLFVQGFSGRVVGAFTDAFKTRKGRLEMFEWVLVNLIRNAEEVLPEKDMCFTLSC